MKLDVKIISENKKSKLRERYESIIIPSEGDDVLFVRDDGVSILSSQFYKDNKIVSDEMEGDYDG